MLIIGEIIEFNFTYRDNHFHSLHTDVEMHKHMQSSNISEERRSLETHWGDRWVSIWRMFSW